MDSWDQAPAASALEELVTTRPRARYTHEPTPTPWSPPAAPSPTSSLCSSPANSSGGPAPAPRGENAHHSLHRAAWLLGLPDPVTIPAPAGLLDPAALDEALAATAPAPLLVAATAGTTDAGLIDPLPDIADLCDAHGARLHIDAAYGGGLLFSPTHRPQLDGLDRAHTVTLDLHKLGWQPVAAGLLAVRDPHDLDAMNHRADYLNADDDTEAGLPDLLGRSLRTTRRPDILKIAVTLRALGRDGLGALVDQVCAPRRAVRRTHRRPPRLRALRPARHQHRPVPPTRRRRRPHRVRTPTAAHRRPRRTRPRPHRRPPLAQGHPAQPAHPARRPRSPPETGGRKHRPMTAQRTDTPQPPTPEEPHDLVGIGIGPFNLSLAALAHAPRRTHHRLLRAAARLPLAPRPPHRRRHPPSPLPRRPGDPRRPRQPLVLPHLSQVPSTGSSPSTSPSASTSTAPNTTPTAAGSPKTSPACTSATRSTLSAGTPNSDLFEVDFTQLDADGEAEALGRTYTRNVVLGVGTAPHIPEPLKPLAEAPAVPVIHSADYLDNRERLLAAEHITVIGSGQSGAEVFLDLLKRPPRRPRKDPLAGPHRSLRPHGVLQARPRTLHPGLHPLLPPLPEAVRDQLVPQQWQLHKGIDADTITAIHDELYRRTLHGGWPDAILTPGVTVRTAGRVATTKVELHLEHIAARHPLPPDHRRRRPRHRLPRTPPRPDCSPASTPTSAATAPSAPASTTDYRLVLDPTVTGFVYVQNAERHTHGVGAPDLGLAAWRSAAILNSLTGKEPYPLPDRTAFTTFGLTPGGAPGQDQAGRRGTLVQLKG